MRRDADPLLNHWLGSLQIRELRNLRRAKLAELAPVNIISGDNGSGKTSLLEAVHVLGRARPMRDRGGPLINYEAEQCAVQGDLFCEGGGGRKRVVVVCSKKVKTRLRLAGRAAHATELAAALPLQLINSEGFLLLGGRALPRRRFMDWGVFYMQPGFHQDWMLVQRSLRQRNALLRKTALRNRNISASINTRRDVVPRAAGSDLDFEFDAWSARLCQAAARVDEARSAYIDKLRPRFVALASRLLDTLAIEFHYKRGWNDDLRLEEAFARSYQRDSKLGFTHFGPHRADLRLSIGGRDALNALSRGQQKLLAAALRIAQGEELSAQRQFSVLYLVDDLCAELDKAHQQRFCQLLGELGGQVLVTCIDSVDLSGMWPDSQTKRFHMKHVLRARQTGES